MVVHQASNHLIEVLIARLKTHRFEHHWRTVILRDDRLPPLMVVADRRKICFVHYVDSTVADYNQFSIRIQAS